MLHTKFKIIRSVSLSSSVILWETISNLFFQPTQKRVSEILQDLRTFQEQGSLELTEVVSRQGRLSFTLSTTYASVGRESIQPLIDIGVGNSPKKGSWSWTESTSHMSRFYETHFPNLSPWCDNYADLSGAIHG
jgi:hypothetical protein